MTESEIKAYRKLPPACRYLTMVLTGMSANLPDGWTNVSVRKLAEAVHVTEVTLRMQLRKIAASGLFDLRSVVRDGHQRVDVKPTFLKLTDPLTAR